MVDTDNTDAPDSDDDDEASAKPARVKNPLALGGLTGKQRRHLRGLGHALSAVVQVGKTGVTPALIENANVQLDAHELIKVKVGEAAPSDRHSTAEELALATKSALAQVLGRTFLLYRKRKKNPAIKLPSAKIAE